MARYLCTNCNFIYDETFWFEEENILPQTFFDDISNDWQCPHCGEWKEHFSLIKEEINYIDKLTKVLNKVEQEHLINYEINNNILELFWNILNHEMEDENHYISEIALYDEYGDLIYNKLFKSWESLEFSSDIKFLDSFEIRIRCIKHWWWSTWIVNV
jgi:rubredoxin